MNKLTPGTYKSTRCKYVVKVVSIAYDNGKIVKAKLDISNDKPRHFFNYKWYKLEYKNIYHWEKI